ncbi:hypothetical protein [Candidatus Uabimicrobium sp. HlEnr_7]|uniref:hypothetical protein n=1 Tax=Candidatus Uabimicrobium helgolandensis TaxID=3095367 RepID=UPI003558821C
MDQIEFLYASVGVSITDNSAGYGIKKFLEYKNNDMPDNVKKMLCSLQERCREYEHVFSVLARKTPYVALVAKHNAKVTLVIPAQVGIENNKFCIEGKVVHDLNTLLQDPKEIQWEILVGDDVGEEKLARLGQEQIRVICDCLYSDTEKQRTFLLFRKWYGVGPTKSKSSFLLVCLLTIVFLTITVYLQRDKILILSQSEFQQRLYKGNLSLELPGSVKKGLFSLQKTIKNIRLHVDLLNTENQKNQEMLNNEEEQLKDHQSLINKEHANEALAQFQLEKLEKERKKQNFLKKIMTVFSKKIKKQKQKIAEISKKIASLEAQRKVMVTNISSLQKKKQSTELENALLLFCIKVEHYFSKEVPEIYSLQLPILEENEKQVSTFARKECSYSLNKEEQQSLEILLQYAQKIALKKRALKFGKQAVKNDFFSRFLLGIFDEKAYVLEKEIPHIQKMLPIEEHKDFQILVDFYMNVCLQNK